jgi:hypothetical protein
MAVWFASAGPEAVAQPAPEMDALAKQLVVQVRTFDKDTDQDVEVGCGLVVGFDDANLTILTARHVVADALKGEARIAVKFSGSSRWLDCDSAPVALGEIDAAFLRIARASSGFSGVPPVDQLIAAPVPARGAQVHVRGFDVDIEQGRMHWRQGVFEKLSDGVVTFDALGVKGGYSGGVVVTDLGVVGMTVRAGPDGKGHTALALPPMLKLVREKGGSVQMNDPAAGAATDALLRLRRESLVAALEVRYQANAKRDVVGFWVALLPKGQQGEGSDAFDGITVSDRAEIRLRTKGATVELEATTDLSASSGPYRGRLSKAIYTLTPDGDARLPGFLVWKGEGAGTTIYLALPTRRTELLAARALAEAASDGARLDLDDRIRKSMIFSDPPHLNGVPRPFSTKWDRDNNIRFRMRLANHRNAPVVLEGELFIADKDQVSSAAKAAKDIENWKSRRFELVAGGAEAGDGAAGTVVSSESMSWGTKPIKLSVRQPTDGFLTLRVSKPARGSGVTNFAMFCFGPRLCYGEN